MHNDLLENHNIKNIHFIGIGGISMSGLAEILKSKGYIVSGSDMKASAITQKLEKMGIKITIGHNSTNISGADLVVYTAAIKENNPELKSARQLGILNIDRAALLGQIMKSYPNSIAISGTHGKTTTTSMISMIMLESGLNPTIHIGGELDAIGGTTRIGSNKYFISEACEYYESFLKFNPYVAIILNVEFDHADYFKDLNHVRQTFHKFANLVPENGYVISCYDQDTNTLLKDINCNKITFGLNKDAMWTAKSIAFDDMGNASYILMQQGKEVTNIELNVPGIHNVSNSLAAIAACRLMGCEIEPIKQALKKFSGTHRRFELKGICENIKVIDDYAHHPSEVRATLNATRNCSHSRIWCVFQPHTYTRTKHLMNEFAVSFDDADAVILSDIYAAREVDNGEVNSGMLADCINRNGNKAIYIKSFEEIVAYLKKNASSGDVIITMGAGDIYKVGEMYLENEKTLAIS